MNDYDSIPLETNPNRCYTAAYTVTQEINCVLNQHLSEVGTDLHLK